MDKKKRQVAKKRIRNKLKEAINRKGGKKNVGKKKVINAEEVKDLKKIAKKAGISSLYIKKKAQQFADKKGAKIRGGAKKILGINNKEETAANPPPKKDTNQPSDDYNYDYGSVDTEYADNVIPEDALEDPVKNDMGYERVGTDREKGFRVDPESGIAYQTYKRHGVTRDLLIGNMPGARIKGGSMQKDVKMIDYDASIKSYDPSKNLDFVEKDKAGNLSMSISKPKRHGYKANDFRTKKQKRDYRSRGILNRVGEEPMSGGQIKKFLIDGRYKKIKTDKQGNLKRLRIKGDGKFRGARDSFPSEIKGKSYSDILESGTGLSNYSSLSSDDRMSNINDRMSGIKSDYNRAKYVKEGKSSLATKAKS
tara:strand:+ start:42 stop:1139 length:1098 start_codon:yes stop_codon:yes gene_type:complete